MEEYKYLRPTNWLPPHIVRTILNFILKHSTFDFRGIHIHQILSTFMGTRIALPYANIFMSKEGRAIILEFLRLTHYWMCDTDDIFSIFLGSHPSF